MNIPTGSSRRLQPFPAYRFDGLTFSGRAVGVFVEDHYYTRNDAAGRIQATGSLTGSVKYIYHGNDGTSMPWNDTAQLN